jgi:hypothetical protein
VVDLLGAPVGAVLFLGAAVLLLTGAIVPANLDPLTSIAARVMGPLVFGFFGLLMAAGAPMSLRRGLRRAVLEVGPDGIWLPEMGRLAWVQIADVRVESVLGSAGEAGITTYRRLGIMPTDPQLTRRERSRLVWRMVGAFTTFVRQLRPSVGAGLPDPERMAPFGIYDYELGGSLDGAVAAISAYRPVS